MAIDEKLAHNIRTALSDAPHVREVKMFGGLGFMLNGNMIAASSDRGLLIRVGPEGEAEALTRPGASVMVMRGRKMAGYIRVQDVPFDARTVKAWMKLARPFVETLPPKAKPKPAAPGTKPKAGGASTKKPNRARGAEK